jgi:hypothetical protein
MLTVCAPNAVFAILGVAVHRVFGTFNWRNSVAVANWREDATGGQFHLY